MNRRGASKLVPDDVPLTTRLAPDADRQRRQARAAEDRRVEEQYMEWVNGQAGYAATVEGDSLSGGSSGQMTFKAGGQKRGKLTPGYITRDACLGNGDDILHSPCKQMS